MMCEHNQKIVDKLIELEEKYGKYEDMTPEQQKECDALELQIIFEE